MRVSGGGRGGGGGEGAVVVVVMMVEKVGVGRPHVEIKRSSIKCTHLKSS